MKSLSVILSLTAILAVSQAFPQESTLSWTVQPSLSLGKYFPGSDLGQQWCPVPILDQTFAPQTVTHFRYEGTSAGVAVRLYPPSVDWLALTLGGGITWYYQSEEQPVTAPQAADAGIGQSLVPADFVSFPFSAGAQVVFPPGRKHDFALHAGIEFAAHFISGSVEMSNQIQAGYGISCGFAVKVFEFGLRYQAFSDMRNLGAYGGIRFAPFDL